MPEFRDPDYDRWSRYWDEHYQHTPDAELNARQQAEKLRIQFWLRHQATFPRKPGGGRYVDGEGQHE